MYECPRWKSLNTEKLEYLQKKNTSTTRANTPNIHNKWDTYLQADDLK